MLKHLEIFTFHNRLNRANFWAYVISISLLAEILTALAEWLFMSKLPYLLGGSLNHLGTHSSFSSFLGAIFICAVRIGALVKIICLNISRLHDRDHSGWQLLIGLIPFLGTIYLLIQFLLPSKEGANRFGEAQNPGFQSAALKKIFIFSCIGTLVMLMLTGIGMYYAVHEEIYRSQVVMAVN